MKLVGDEGTVQILTDINEDSQFFRELLSYIASSSFKLSNSGKVYFPKDWDSGSSLKKHSIHVLVFVIHTKLDDEPLTKNSSG